jgi:hypothetical protein
MLNFNLTKQLPINTQFDYTDLMFISMDNDCYYEYDLEPDQCADNSNYLPIWSYSEILELLQKVAIKNKLSLVINSGFDYTEISFVTDDNHVFHSESSKEFNRTIEYFLDSIYINNLINKK